MEEAEGYKEENERKDTARLRYSRGHQWVERLSPGGLRIGLTPYGLERTGDLVFVDLMDPGEVLQAGQAYGELESVRSVWDICSPVSGRIRAVNQRALLHPEELKTRPYQTWLVELEDAAEEEFARELMDETAYQIFLHKTKYS